MREINFIVSKIIKPALKGYYPVLLTLRRNWQYVIGDKYFEYCEPEKIIFKKDKKNLGTLYLITFNAVVSFYIENNRPFVIEKVNSILGHGCELIADIKIKQNPKIINKKSDEIIFNPEQQKAVDKKIEIIEDNELKLALRELGQIFI